MMKNKQLTLLSCAFIAFSFHLQAQNNITLDTLISQVLRNNPGYQSMQTQIRSAEARVSQATAWSDPQIGVELMGTPVTSLNPITNSMERRFFIEQMLPFPGKKTLAGDVAQSGVRINASNAVVYQRNLIQSVKKEYVMLYAAQRRIEVNAESQSLVKQMIASAEARYGVAQASQADILKLQIELSKLMNERAALEHDLRVPIAMINTLRSMPVDAVIGRLAEIELDPYSFDLEQLTAKALNQRPELKTMQYEIDMNNSELAMWKKERLPDFMVGASYNQMPEITNTWEVMFGINISIAPWASGKYSGKIEESKQNIRRVEQSRMDMSNMVVFEVYDSWIKGKAHWEIADRLKRTMIPQAEQALQSLLIAYQTHQTDFLSLLDSFRMLNMYRMEYFMEIADHLMHVADLERAVGGELK